jgi:hypothetical protein
MSEPCKKCGRADCLGLCEVPDTVLLSELERRGASLSVDLAALPTETLYSEIGRRRQALRRDFSTVGRTGPKTKPRHCPKCGKLQPSATLAQKHCVVPRKRGDQESQTRVLQN